MSVKVAVRVRPFNTREKEMGAQLCVKMVGQTTTIKDLKTDATRDFSFDYSFWSHSGYEEDENGYMYKVEPSYADQQHVYECLGQQVLDNAWEGYHCCLFAYGQTGSGKSYSMVGYGSNKGIIPISSSELFKRVHATQSETVSYEITVSMLEIYNERVQDLLIDVSKRPQGGLKIRENKVTGVFVENLSHHPVNSYAEIEALMELGNVHRSIGSTQMNATSSRAHTIFTIEFKQVETFENRKAEKLSVINLVDLAGSEKAGQTGATGDRLKEGCAINKSLVVLGTCIERLADKSQGKSGNIVVPYRESALTRILSNALGGNSKTVMICAISPASVNFEESLSTLRYADRAKKIKNHAVVNESVQDKIIRELKGENDELKKLIESAGGLERIRELQEQLAANEQITRQQTMTWEQRRVAVDDRFEMPNEITTIHMTNLNEDPQLSGKVKYTFDKVPIIVGRKNADRPIDIVLSSSSVRPVHCTFDKDEEGKITLTPFDEFSSDFLYVNGKKITEMVYLEHQSRIIIGTTTVFVLLDPEQGPLSMDIDYEMAIQEKADAQQEAIELAIPLPTPVVAAEPANSANSANPVNSANPASPDQVQASGGIPSQVPGEGQVQGQVQEQVLDQPQQQRGSVSIPGSEEPNKKRQIHSQLARLFPLINEANLLVTDLGRNTEFQVKIINVLPEDVEKEEDLEAEQWVKETMVQVVNQDYGLIWHWDFEKFEDRLVMLRELLEEPNAPSLEDDPLWDPPEDSLIGKAYYSLKPLGFLFDNPFDILIIGSSGGDAGHLKVDIIPIDDKGDPLREGPETPEEIIGQLINFSVVIKEARDLPPNHSNNVYCEYHFPSIGIRRTQVVSGFNTSPVFNYREDFHGVLLDEYLCNYLQTKKLAVSVFGTGMTMKVETQTVPKVRPSYETLPAKVPSVEKEIESGANRNYPAHMNSSFGKKGKKDKKDKKDCIVF